MNAEELKALYLIIIAFGIPPIGMIFALLILLIYDLFF